MGLCRLRRGPLVVGLVLLAVACAPAASLAASPVVLTGAETNLTSTSAVLNGMASSDIPGSTYYFQYGTSPSYDHKTTPTPLSGDGVESVSASISGLLPGTTYHYRLVVALPDGEIDPGRDAMFTTPATPGSVATTGQATDVAGNSAALNGVVNTSDPKPQWFFEYGRTRAYGRATPVHAARSGLTVVSAKVTGLRPHTIYHFRLVVQQSQGPTADGRDGFFKTARTYGHATVRRHRVKIRHGTAAIAFICAGTPGSVCDGRVSLKTRTRVHKHLAIIGCGRGRLAMVAGHRRTVAFKLGPRCGSLLHDVPHGQLGATLTAVFSSHQPRLQTHVTLLKS
jgi:hypothetical protein